MQKVRMHLTAIIAASNGTTEDLPDSVIEGQFRRLETRVRHRGGAFDFRIIALAANPMTARGYTGDLLLDEFAMHADDREIWSAVFPIALRGRGEIDICSTPKGRKNMFYRLANNAQFARSPVTIHDAVAGGLDVDIEQVRQGMGDDDLFRQEFLCEFLDEATAFLTFEMIATCEDARLCKVWNDAKRQSCEAEDLYAGVDVGRYRDLTVIWIWGRPKGGDVLYTRGVIELFKVPFAVQADAIGAILAQRNTQRCCIDATGLGMQLAEQLAEHFGKHRVEQVTFTAASKADMAGALRVKVEDRLARIPVDADIRNDWHSIERQVLPGGGIRYAADRGAGGTAGHADRFWAGALGVRAASTGAYEPFEFQSAGKPVYAEEGLW